MMKVHTTVVMFAAAALLAPPCWTQEQGPSDTERRETLKKSMKARYARLLKLKDVGKVGETRKGFVAVRKEVYAGHKVDPRHGAFLTIGKLIEAENKDRKELYEVVARLSQAKETDENKRKKITAESVALHNVVRNYNKADAKHWLQEKDGTWLKKADLVAKRLKEKKAKEAKKDG